MLTADQCLLGDAADSVDGSADVNSDHKSSFRHRAKQRLASLRRRKEFAEQDIILRLGLSQDDGGFEAFCDKFNSVEYVSSALMQAGFQSCDIVIGIDFSASNEWQGKRSFNRRSLHKTSGSKVFNPYQKVLHILGSTLSFMSSDRHIYVYGFGDKANGGAGVFPLADDGTLFSDYQQVIDAYTSAAQSVELGGPTNFAPMVRQAVRLCGETGEYHILILIVDGQVSSTCRQETIDALVEASNHPLSIIVIGIGDGPFGTMFEYDDGLPQRKFDNVQFVNFHRTVTKSKHEAAFALHALMEIPDQYKAIQQLGYLSR